MTVRTWVYERLMTTPGLTAYVGDRVFAKKSMTSSVEAHPFIVFKLGYSTDENLAETETVGRQFVQIYIHDYSDGEVADYLKIDEVISEVKEAFHLKQGGADGVFLARYLETSQDLGDETLNTVMKYIRLQIITKEI